MNSEWVVTHEIIADRARELWRSKGCPRGQDEAIWLEAERSLRMAHQIHPAAVSPTNRASISLSKSPATPPSETSLPPAASPSFASKNCSSRPLIEFNSFMENIFGDVFEEIDFDSMYADQVSQAQA